MIFALNACSFFGMATAIQTTRLTGTPFYRFPTWGWGLWVLGDSVWVWEIRRSWRRTGWTAPGAALSDRETTTLENYLHLVKSEQQTMQWRKMCTCTQNKQAVVHFSPLLSACWAPTWWSSLQNINISSQLMYSSVTFFCLRLYHKCSSAQKPKVSLCQHFCSVVPRVLTLARNLSASFTFLSRTLAVPKFTSGSILSRNWDSTLWGERKSARSWLLLSSGCCRSFCGWEKHDTRRR